MEENKPIEEKKVMTMERRREIFAKDCLTISDIGELLELNYDGAAKVMRNIKRKSDRLEISGKIHVQDYLDYFNIPSDRYLVTVN